MKYASATTVTSEKSRADIEITMRRYGASSFMYGTSPERAIVAFEANGRRIKFVLPMPDRSAREITHTNHKWPKLRSQDAQLKAYEQATRQRWRALGLAIKAKLEAVESGIATFEDEFLAYMVLPNGETVGQHMIPQISTAYETGKMPPLLGKL